MGGKISNSTMQRLPKYLAYLRTLPQDESSYESATNIAASLHLGEVLVRKDLSSISRSGKPKVGYKVSVLITELEKALGYKGGDEAILVGIGKLGRTIFEYDGFADCGVNIVAGFDLNDNVYELAGKKIYPIRELENFCRIHQIQIGVITVPEQQAQQICDLMVKSGIRAIMNFASVYLEVPKDIIVQHENIAVALAALSHELKKKESQK